MKEGNRAGRRKICRNANEYRVNKVKYVGMLRPWETCENKRGVRDTKKKRTSNEYWKKWVSGLPDLEGLAYINLYLWENFADWFPKLEKKKFPWNIFISPNWKSFCDKNVCLTCEFSFWWISSKFKYLWVDFRDSIEKP